MDQLERAMRHSVPKPSALVLNYPANPTAEIVDLKFYSTVVDFCRENEFMDVSGAPHAGVLSGADMAHWSATYEDPLTYDFHGYTVMKGRPWCQGPVLQQHDRKSVV